MPGATSPKARPSRRPNPCNTEDHSDADTGNHCRDFSATSEYPGTALRHPWRCRCGSSMLHRLRKRLSLLRKRRDPHGAGWRAVLEANQQILQTPRDQLVRKTTTCPGEYRALLHPSTYSPNRKVDLRTTVKSQYEAQRSHRGKIRKTKTVDYKIRFPDNSAGETQGGRSGMVC